jgi:hypothetical protein
MTAMRPAIVEVLVMNPLRSTVFERRLGGSDRSADAGTAVDAQVCPVMNAASSERRKHTAADTSLGRPMRRMGTTSR